MNELKEDKLALNYFGDTQMALFDSFSKAARSQALEKEFDFFHTTDVNCGKNFGTNGNSIVLVRKFDEPHLKFRGGGENKLIEFAEQNAMPRVLTFKNKYIDTIFG